MGFSGVFQRAFNGRYLRSLEGTRALAKRIMIEIKHRTMSSDYLMRLGSCIFAMETAACQQLQHSNADRWQVHDRPSAYPSAACPCTTPPS